MKDYKWAYAAKAKQLNKIMDLLDKDIEIIQDSMIIIPDNYREIVGEKHLKEFSKDFYTYTNYHYTFLLRSDYEKRCTQRELQKRKEREKEQNRKKAEEENKKLENKRDQTWIEDNIGKYFTWEPQMEYYWTIIGDSWKLAQPNWKENIIIEEGMYKKIEQMEYCGLKGSVFLNRKFNNKKGYSAGIIGTYRKPAEHYGVYGIKVNDELIYIGSTMREFEERFQEHKENIAKKSKELKVYSLLEGAAPPQFEIMFDCGEQKSINGDLHEYTVDEVKSIEYGYIHLLKPRGNRAGNTLPFIY